MMVAWQEGHLSDDIAEEQHKLEQAELVIFQVIVSPVLHSYKCQSLHFTLISENNMIWIIFILSTGLVYLAL